MGTERVGPSTRTFPYPFTLEYGHVVHSVGIVVRTARR
jgi:hypothetical protein